MIFNTVKAGISPNVKVCDVYGEAVNVPEGASANRVLCDGDHVIPAYVQKRLDKKLRKTIWIGRQRADGKYTIFSGAVAGNKVHAHRRGIKTDHLADRVMGGKPNYCTFVTVTKQYVKTEAGRRESWVSVRAELTNYIRRLKRQGLEDYVYVLEAHEDGGCHVHLLMRWKKEIHTYLYNGKLRITNRELLRRLKEWDGHVDVLGIGEGDVERIAGYVSKELGKYGQYEDALKRAKRNWGKEGDDKKRNSDKKRLWTYYYADVLRIRLYGSGRKERGKQTQLERSERREHNDLITNMINSTKPEEYTQIQLPWHIVHNDRFEPYTGFVDPDSWTYKELTKLFDRKNNNPFEKPYNCGR
jgi:hypothetical protein